MTEWAGKLLSGVITGLIGLAAGLIAYFWVPAKDKAELDLKYFDVAFRILENNVTCQIGIRTWAVQILNSHSPKEAQMTTDAQQQLIGKGCDSPKLAATLPQSNSAASQSDKGGLADQIGVLETQGLEAVLQKDLPSAVNRFATAYRLWPVYRNTDEILRILKEQNAKPPKDADEWTALYKRIANCDLFGVDEKTQDSFAKAAGLVDGHELTIKADTRACK